MSEKDVVAKTPNRIVSASEAMIFVAKRIKTARCIKKMTMSNMAANLGITRKQLQNYETAQSNITVARLWQISKIFDVDTSFFVEGLNASKQLLSDDDLEIIRAFGKIKDTKVKETLWEIIKAI